MSEVLNHVIRGVDAEGNTPGVRECVAISWQTFEMYTVLEPDSVGLGWDPGICFSRRACQKILGSQVQELLLKPIQIMTHCKVCVRREVLMVRK